MEKFFATLKASPLFYGITDNDFPQLLKYLQAYIVNYYKQDFIFLAGSPTLNVGIVCEGKAQVIREDIMGNRTILSDLEAGDLFGETFACAKVDILPVSVVALTDCTVLFIDYRMVIVADDSASLPFHSKLVENMLSVLAQKNLLLNHKMQILSARGMRDKIINYLLSEADRNKSSSFCIPFNRQQLADYLSVDRSALSAELGRMRDIGLLVFEKNHFRLLFIEKDTYNI